MRLLLPAQYMLEFDKMDIYGQLARWKGREKPGIHVSTPVLDLQ